MQDEGHVRPRPPNPTVLAVMFRASRPKAAPRPVPASLTPRTRLLRLGWWPAWAVLIVSLGLHLLSGEFSRLEQDAAFTLIILVSMALGRLHPLSGILLFYAALAPFALWIDQLHGVGWALTPDLGGYTAVLILPAALAAVYFGFRGTVVFLLYSLVVGTLALPLDPTHLSGVAWNVLLALGLGGLGDWLLRGAGREMVELRRSALLDPLTGLANRRAFDHALDQAWASRPDLAVVLLDLDGLKGVNDTRGHAAGDELLREFAQALQRHLGTETMAFRLGGDEYAVLCEVDDLPTVQKAVGAAVLQVQQAGFLEVGASVGSASAAEVRSSGALVRLADERMYTEKRGKPQRRTQMPA
ncbi:GGDEF domain-containing protein [Deinococcus planocerae]|uniref:GGDEF domain-containing protein n=1 Tax=Deinococcus planocerae TaxID=1737569 RepID=UPI001FE62DC1|nr:sensor domain-containing diguanylate cyclase [Deinococcus planocerae]